MTVIKKNTNLRIRRSFTFKIFEYDKLLRSSETNPVKLPFQVQFINRLTNCRMIIKQIKDNDTLIIF